MRTLALASLSLSILGAGCGASSAASPSAEEPSPQISAAEPTPQAAAAPASSTPPTTPPAAPAEEEGVVGPPEVAWADMTKGQRAKYMRKVVVPKMKELFQAFDGEEFARFGCKTCHGAGATDHSYAMPNAQLPKIPATAEGFAALGKDKPKWLAFMGGKVKPQMAELLGLPPFDHDNPAPNAFGCGNCHTEAAP